MKLGELAIHSDGGIVKPDELCAFNAPGLNE
jgi:hypothetical protein